jgi:NADPH-dependent curcumin reductase CurA
MNKQILLAARPVGFPKESDFRLVETPVPPPEDGEFRVKVHARESTRMSRLSCRQ